MIVASRYAKSLLELANDNGQLESVYADMLSLKSLCHDSKEFVSFLHSPIIKEDKKVSTLKAIFDGKVNATTSSFLTLVANKRREGVLPQIANEFIAQYKAKKNILTAVVTSAKGLDEATKQQALALVKSQLNGEIELIEKIDADIIGGFILKIGDKQIDKSVARQLSNLKKALTTN